MELAIQLLQVFFWVTGAAGLVLFVWVWIPRRKILRPPAASMVMTPGQALVQIKRASILRRIRVRIIRALGGDI